MDARKPLSPPPDPAQGDKPHAAAESVSGRCAICDALLPPAKRPGEAAACLSCLLLAGIGRPLRHDTERAVRIIGERFGNYDVLEEIGRGGMGVIYRARQKLEGAPERIVALKTIRAARTDDLDSLERFQREAEAAASLAHPNILPIYEVGEVDGQPFFSMQFAAGGNLAEAQPRFAGRPREAVALVLKIVRAIAHAHEHGVLHRDLKPVNILLDSVGEPLVADFGLAKWLDRQSDLTQSLIVFGTPGYLAPEQAAGRANRATPAADIYSLGAILYELLCGRPPFIGANAWEVLQQAAHRPAPSLRKWNPQASRRLETICARCLETEPAARYPDAAALAEDLQRWLDGRPIRAQPLPAPVRAWRWAKRNPLIAAAGAACVLSGLMSLAKYMESRQLDAALHEAALARATVAVLPLEDLDTLGEPSPQTRAVSEKIQQRLAREPALRAVAAPLPPDGDTTSPQNWRMIGRSTRAAAVFSGSIRHRADGTLHVALRLASTKDARVLAQRTLDCEAGQTDSIAEAAAALGADVRRAWENAPDTEEIAGATTSPEARDYLRTGKEFLLRQTPEDAHRSVVMFERAVEIDPRCALAHALLASNYAALFGGQPSHDWLRKAHVEADTAIRLDPSLAEAHRALGRILAHEGHPKAAVEELLTAYELSPAEERAAQLLGWHAQSLGQPLEALHWMEVAERRSTQPGKFAAWFGDLYVELSADELAEAVYRKARELRPSSTDGPLGLCRLWILQGRFGQACDECRRLALEHPGSDDVRMMAAAAEFFGRNFPEAETLYRKLVDNDRHGGEEFPGCLGHLCILGYLRQRAGDQAEGGALLAEAREQAAAEIQRDPELPRHLFALAAALAAAGEVEPALDALEQAVAAGWIDHRSMRLDPRFDSVAAEPRYQEILSRLAAKSAAWRQQRLAATAAGPNPTQ